MNFAMGAETLFQLTTATSAASDDLGGLVRELFVAVEPLQGRFNGVGRAAFDRFKDNTDEIADELDAALRAVLGGIDGQNKMGRRDFDIAASQEAQARFERVATRVEALIGQRDADVRTAMANYEASAARSASARRDWARRSSWSPASR